MGDVMFFFCCRSTTFYGNGKKYTLTHSAHFLLFLLFYYKYCFFSFINNKSLIINHLFICTNFKSISTSLIIQIQKKTFNLTLTRFRIFELSIIKIVFFMSFFCSHCTRRFVYLSILSFLLAARFIS